MINDEYYIKKTIELSKKAAKHGDFPVGALIVKDNKIIAKAYNTKEKNNNAINHAETLAISKACKKLKTWHLDDCILYTSMEPCIMCLGAIIQSRIKKIVYSTHNPSFGSIENDLTKFKLNIEINKLEKEEYMNLIKEFFKDKR